MTVLDIGLLAQGKLYYNYFKNEKVNEDDFKMLKVHKIESYADQKSEKAR